MRMTRISKRAKLGTTATSPVVTEGKRMEEILKETEQKYGVLFESLNDAVFLADAETGGSTSISVKTLTSQPGLAANILIRKLSILR